MSITSTELCGRAGITRDVLNFWTKKLGIASTGSRNEKNTLVLLWPESAVRQIRRAYSKRRRRNGNG